MHSKSNYRWGQEGYPVAVCFAADLKEPLAKDTVVESLCCEEVKMEKDKYSPLHHQLQSPEQFAEQSQPSLLVCSVF